MYDRKGIDKTEKQSKIIGTACGFQCKSGCGQRFSCTMLRLPQWNQLAARRFFLPLGRRSAAMEHKENNFLEQEPVGRLMMKYAVPCIISLLVAALYNIVDQSLHIDLHGA